MICLVSNLVDVPCNREELKSATANQIDSDELEESFLCAVCQVCVDAKQQILNSCPLLCLAPLILLFVLRCCAFSNDASLFVNVKFSTITNVQLVFVILLTCLSCNPDSSCPQGPDDTPSVAAVLAHLLPGVCGGVV